jgi:hypothetical protein
MTIVSPLSWYGILRASTLLLFGLTLLWTGISLLAFGDLLFSQLVAAVVLGVSALLGPLVYLRFYRLRLQYDEHGFALFSGRQKIAAGQWQHFKQVSLYHRGNAVFAVRLYTLDKSHIDIPVSDLKLDPQAFRALVTQRVNAPPS